MVGVSVNPEQRVDSSPTRQTQPTTTPSTERGIDFGLISLDNFSFSSSLLPQAGFSTRSDAQYSFAPAFRFSSATTDEETPVFSSPSTQSIPPYQTPTASSVQPRQQQLPTEPFSSTEPQPPSVTARTDISPEQDVPLPVGEIIAGLMRGASFPPGTTFTYPDGRTGVLVGDGQGNAAPAHVTAAALARAIGFANPQAFLAAQPQSQPSREEQPQIVTQPSPATLEEPQIPLQAPVSTGRILRLSPEDSP